jgi:hypothetical protein
VTADEPTADPLKSGERESTPQERGEMSASEYRFLEPFLDKACFMCGKKDSFRRVKKLVHCTGCHTEFMPMPDGKLAVMNRPVAA